MANYLRGIFIVGCIVLLLVCVAGFLGLFEAPPVFYLLFWGGFLVFMGILFMAWRILLVMHFWDYFDD
jgi:hypothetical protein